MTTAIAVNVREVNAADFHAAIHAALKSERGAFLTPYTLDEYAAMRCFLIEDNSAGGAVKHHENGENELVSGFNVGEIRGAGGAVMDYRVANTEGPHITECFGEKLRSLYERRGFVVRECYPFNAEFAPSNWNYERDGEPNYYVLEYKG